MIEPVGPAYYAAIAYKRRPEDERACGVCNGASFVRHGELVPGQFGFGRAMRCPNWRADMQRCEARVDAMGLPA